MKTFFSTLFFTILFFTVNGQAPYFQQTVNNKIEITLDDKTHNLIGTIQIKYTNNSPDELTIIYLIIFLII